MRKRQRKKNKWEKTFHSLCVPPLVHTCAIATPECRHFQQTPWHIEKIAEIFIPQDNFEAKEGWGNFLKFFGVVIIVVVRSSEVDLRRSREGEKNRRDNIFLAQCSG